MALTCTEYSQVASAPRPERAAAMMSHKPVMTLIAFRIVRLPWRFLAKVEIGPPRWIPSGFVGSFRQCLADKVFVAVARVMSLLRACGGPG